MKTIISAATALALTTSIALAGGSIAPVETTVVTTEVAPIEVNKDFYVGIGITAPTTYLDGQKDFFEDRRDSEISGGLEVKAGYVFYRNEDISVAIEGQAGRSYWGFDNDDLYTYDYAAFIKPMYAFGNTSVYGLAGFAKSGIADGSSDDSIQENGFAYGIGAEYAVTETVAVYADYTMLPAFTDDVFEDINNDKVALGINYKF